MHRPSAVSLLTGDALSVLRYLPGDCYHACVTSPPYYGLRDYGTAVWEGGDPDCEHVRPVSFKSSTLGASTGGRSEETHARSIGAQSIPYRAICGNCGARRIDLQIGLEQSPEDYISHLVEIFREVRRVLRPDGTCWIVIGDSYNNIRVSQRGQTVHKFESRDKPVTRRRGTHDLKEKDLIGIPWMLAFALRADGWWLRQVIIYAKGSCMPESIHDRPTQSHEYVLLLTKSRNYFFDEFAVAEDAADPNRPPQRMQASKAAVAAKSRGPMARGREGFNHQFEDNGRTWGNGGKRRIRSVWHINPEPLRQHHYAAMPTRLAARCIQAGVPEFGCCATCGAPYKRIIEKTEPDAAHMLACGADSHLEYNGQSQKDYAGARAQDASATKARILAGMQRKVTVGWQPTCDCEGRATEHCRVLDPFSGAGTTMLAATRLGHDSTGIDLKPEYHAIARERLLDKHAKCLDTRGNRLPYRAAILHEETTNETAVSAPASASEQSIHPMSHPDSATAVLPIAP